MVNTPGFDANDLVSHSPRRPLGGQRRSADLGQGVPGMPASLRRREPAPGGPAEASRGPARQRDFGPPPPASDEGDHGVGAVAVRLAVSVGLLGLLLLLFLLPLFLGGTPTQTAP
ncbi:unnamed protein product [Prorocentrum cordatum]|uniref:Uncharacterized protein n=1 Tax=Prorocentrum cordatum TaxID=2364126 RepID=A0ABN9X8P2_9DINO|nr:unnamed protein product [Polarella glacialis]CAK0895203.1 unnamed protein product [Polarella glacialis]